MYDQRLQTHHCDRLSTENEMLAHTLANALKVYIIVKPIKLTKQMAPFDSICIN